jgi:hypothetical protein
MNVSRRYESVTLGVLARPLMRAVVATWKSRPIKGKLQLPRFVFLGLPLRSEDRLVATKGVLRVTLDVVARLAIPLETALRSQSAVEDRLVGSARSWLCWRIRRPFRAGEYEAQKKALYLELFEMLVRTVGSIHEKRVRMLRCNLFGGRTLLMGNG